MLSQLYAVKHHLVLGPVVVAAHISLAHGLNILHGSQELGGHGIGHSKIITVNLEFDR